MSMRLFRWIIVPKRVVFGERVAFPTIWTIHTSLQVCNLLFVPCGPVPQTKVAAMLGDEISLSAPSERVHGSPSNSVQYFI